MKRKVLITGSSDGIGACIAEKFAAQSYEVLLTGRNEEKLKKVAKKCNTDSFFAIDLTEKNSTDIIFEKAGNIDILINNAGEYIYSNIEKMKKQDIERIIKLNFEIPYILISKFVPYMKEQKFGRIINIGSISSVVGESGASLYSATKSSFIGMTKALALELAQDFITINTINPGFVNTNLLKNTFDESFSEKELLDVIPQSRFLEPDEIASLAIYLASEEAKGLTGQMINLCAGMSCGC